jgi:hypothetical protein
MMASYDIRLIKLGCKASIFRVTEVSDLAAICAARHAAADGDRVEVWRGMDCIYADGVPKSPLEILGRSGKIAAVRYNA